MKLAALLVFVLGCQSEKAGKAAKGEPAAPVEITAASCRPFLTKARVVLQEMGSAAGMSYTQTIEEQAIKDCEADLAAGRPSDLMKCVLAANTTDAVRACFPTYDQVKQRGAAPK